MKDFEFIDAASVDNLEKKDSKELLNFIKSMEEENDEVFYVITKILSSKYPICDEFPSIKKEMNQKSNEEIIEHYFLIQNSFNKKQDVLKYIAILQIINERSMDSEFFNKEFLHSDTSFTEKLENFDSFMKEKGLDFSLNKFISNAKENINDFSRKLNNIKNIEQPVAKFNCLIDTVSIFSGRVEIGSLIPKSYEIGEVKSVVIESVLFSSTLSLALTNNKKSPSVSLNKKDTELCKTAIEALIKEHRSSDKGPTIKLDCDVLGGFGTDFIIGYRCYIAFRDKYVHFESPSNKISLSMKISDIAELKIGGEGKKEKIYGGIGGIGDSGAAIALPIKSSTIKTTLEFKWTNGALFLNTSEYTPEDVAIILSPITSQVDKGSNSNRVSCPRCAEMIMPNAKVCRFCRTEFDTN